MRVSFVCTVALLMAALAAGAGPLDPLDFSSLGGLPGGVVVIATSSTPTVNGTAAGVVVSQTGGPEIAVFCFDGGALLDAVDTITVTGSRPAALLFQGEATLLGATIVSAGGGAGGASLADGWGIGSGQGSSQGAGGGGFGGSGGDGGGAEGGAGGLTYGTSALDPVYAGSGGGGGGGVGGNGGGGIEIGSLALLTVEGEIHADGASGAAHTTSGGGAGSGGGIFLHAFSVEIGAAFVTADGGDGGSGSYGGGGGGGGRITVMYNQDGSVTIAPEAVIRHFGGNGGDGVPGGDMGSAGGIGPALTTDPDVGEGTPPEVPIFSDGFESGNTTRWSTTVP